MEKKNEQVVSAYIILIFDVKKILGQAFAQWEKMDPNGPFLNIGTRSMKGHDVILSTSWCVWLREEDKILA